MFALNFFCVHSSRINYYSLWLFVYNGSSKSSKRKKALTIDSLVESAHVIEPEDKKLRFVLCRTGKNFKIQRIFAVCNLCMDFCFIFSFALYHLSLLLLCSLLSVSFSLSCQTMLDNARTQTHSFRTISYTVIGPTCVYRCERCKHSYTND